MRRLATARSGYKACEADIAERGEAGVVVVECVVVNK